MPPLLPFKCLTIIVLIKFIEQVVLPWSNLAKFFPRFIWIFEPPHIRHQKIRGNFPYSTKDIHIIEVVGWNRLEWNNFITQLLKLTHLNQFYLYLFILCHNSWIYKNCFCYMKQMQGQKTFQVLVVTLTQYFLHFHLFEQTNKI